MKIRALVLAVIAGLIGAITLTAPAAQAHTPYCGITWGSLSEGGGLVGGRTAHQRPRRPTRLLRPVGPRLCRRRRRFQVGYVSAIEGIGLPRPVDLRGGALLEIVVQTPYGEDAPSFWSGYDPRNPNELVDVAGWRTFRQVSLVGGLREPGRPWDSASGLGCRSGSSPSTVRGTGSRIVIDVAHRW